MAWIPVKVRGALFDVKAKQFKSLVNKINAVISVIVCVCVVLVHDSTLLMKLFG